MTLQKIVAGNYGYKLSLTYIDVDTDEEANLSSYDTAQEIHVRAPDGSVAEYSGGWGSDGTDGVVEYTVQSGDIPAKWSKKRIAARIHVESATAQLSSEWQEFELL
jgi:hypothetical protein